jgi:GNAT superfamily N-acetyltransferase
MPEGPPGVAVEVGRVRGTGMDLPERGAFRPGTPAERLPDSDADRYVVARDDTGRAIGVLRMTVADLEKKLLDVEAGLTVYVRPENRRQGVATRLYEEAARQGYNIRDVAGRGDLTPAGAALNRAMNAIDSERREAAFAAGLDAERKAVRKEAAAAAVRRPDDAMSMVSFIKSRGGIKDEGGLLKAMDLNRRFPGLVNNKKGTSLDYMREALEEAGYLRSKDVNQTTDIADLLDALDRTSRGESIYPYGQTHRMGERGAIDPFLDAYGEETAVVRAHAKAYDLPPPDVEDMRAIVAAVGSRKEGETAAQWHERVRSAADDQYERRAMSAVDEEPRVAGDPEPESFRDPFDLTDDVDAQGRLGRRAGDEPEPAAGPAREDGAGGQGAADVGIAQEPIRSREDLNAAIKEIESPEIIAAREAEVEQILKADPERTVQISDGDTTREVRLKDLLDEAKTMEREAETIYSCAMGVPF